MKKKTKRNIRLAQPPKPTMQLPYAQSIAKAPGYSPYGLDRTKPQPYITHRQPLGVTGTKNYAGYADEEYLKDLRGRKAADVFDKMRRNDPQIIMCASAVKNPILGGVWDMEPGEDTPEAKADADFVKDILFNNPDVPFRRFLEEILTEIDFGHSVFEVTWKAVIDDPKWGTYNGIQDLGWRSPRTIERWHLDPITSRLASIDQYAFGDLYRIVNIPAEYLIVFTMKREGSNYEGVSMFRPCYGNWYRKNVSLKTNAIGSEKYAVPTPIGKIEAGKQGDPAFDELAEVFEAYTSHQKAYIICTKDVDIELKPSPYDPSKLDGTIDAEDRRMVKGFLANFLELGMGSSGGAYALSNDLSDFFLCGIEHIANSLQETINHQLVRKIVDMNASSKRSVYPKLVHSGISDKAGKELSEVLKLLIDSKAIIPDDQLEKSLRMRYSLPAVSDEGKRELTPPSGVFQSTPTMAERIRAIRTARGTSG